MRRHPIARTLTALVLPVLIGCQGVKFPSVVGKYVIEEKARSVMEKYTASILLPDYEAAMVHIFGLVDANGDNRVDHKEARKAVEHVIPYAERFRDDLTSIQIPATQPVEP